ncbi:MAG: permease-like cell division protein FtsX [Pseudomonadota bacterium]
MVLQLVKRAVSDILANPFLNVMTMATIALSILMVSSIVLLMENTGRFVRAWNSQVRMMAYLDPGLDASALSDLKQAIESMADITKVSFISREKALEALKQDLETRHLSLDGLRENPLPDGLELSVSSPEGSWEKVQAVAAEIETLPGVSGVEYGQEWMGWLFGIFGTVRTVGYAMAGFFCMMALFITSNTVRLALFSRREEVDIMRLVGATDRFIIMPFYVEGLLQGMVGGIMGMGLLLVAYMIIVPGLQESFFTMTGLALEFISVKACAAMILFSGFLGWLGCYLSLRRILA